VADLPVAPPRPLDEGLCQAAAECWGWIERASESSAPLGVPIGGPLRAENRRNPDKLDARSVAVLDTSLTWWAPVDAWLYHRKVIPHGAAELLLLAERCACSEPENIHGWHVDIWSLDDDAVRRLFDTYRAVLLGDTETDDAYAQLLNEAGIPLDELLIDEEDANDRITRADAVELAGAASLLAADNWPPNTLHMPNVPAMSRAKSDSGNDVTAVILLGEAGSGLIIGERLFVASVKHTVSADIADVRRKLTKSVFPKTLTASYMALQLRVFSARLAESGMPAADSKRVFLFLRNWPDFNYVQIHAIAGVDASNAGVIDEELEKLPLVEDHTYRFRVLLIPDLTTLHERLP
jgi:hypothetical protein